MDSDFLLQTDSAGSVGFGAVWGSQWCTEVWPDRWVSNGFCKNIVLLELFPVVVALEIWGPMFANRRLLVGTDNKGVAFAVNSLSSKSPLVVVFLRHLVFLCLKWSIWIKARYVPGKNNEIANSFSSTDGPFFQASAGGGEGRGAPPFAPMGSNLIYRSIQDSVAPSTWKNYVSSWLSWATFLNTL